MSITPYSYGNIPTYRFYISEVVGSTTYEVFPLNFLSSSLVDEPEKDNVFYRRKFNGSLLFGTNSLVIDNSGVTQNRKDDWFLLWGIEQSDPCAKLYLIITKTVSGVTTTYWEGYFSTTDGKFDIDKCTFEVAPILNDDYVDLLDKADTQYNILAVAPTVTTRAIEGVIDVTFTRNRWLLDVIEFLADKVVAGVSVSSDFFTNATNPVTLADNHLLHLTIAQKSDIIRPTSSDPAKTAMMSWTELTEILWGVFQVKWEYDSVSNTINVEHISWWSKGLGIDLRTQLSAKATNKYSYLKEKMPKYEKFSFMEAFNVSFVGTPIWYDSACVNPDPKSNVKELTINVTTDLQYIIDNPTAIADEGFVILCNYENAGLYYVELEGSALDNDIKINMHLSWANLENKYYRHNRVLIEGYLNNVLTTFWTAQKNKVQPCSIIVCDDFDPAKEITTELGEAYLSGAKGTVDKSELNPTGELKLTLLYGPPDTIATPMPDSKWLLIQEDACGHLYATLSEPADANLNVVISHEVLDSGGAFVCSGGPETWIIPIGSRTDDIGIAVCGGGMPAGGCINYAWDFTAITGWIITTQTKCEC